MSRVVRNDVKALLTTIGSTSSIRVPKSRMSIIGQYTWTYSTSTDRTRCIRPVATGSTATQIARRRFSRSAIEKNASSSIPDEASADPKPPSPPLAVVFTDIVKSTMLWEKDSPAMSEAMDVHDNFVRRLAAKYEGYEVKQNGDGFMFAFYSATSALNFCLDVQINLQDQEWPDTLLDLGPAEPVVKVQEKSDRDSPDKVVLWKGLRLRMSAHYGSPVCKWNDVIGRMDYLGPAVNRAARYVSVCEGGQIVVSEDFLDELKRVRREIVGSGGPLFDAAKVDNNEAQDLDLTELQGEDVTDHIEDTRFELRLLGERHFKGVPDRQKLFFILPKSLRGRLDYLPRHQYVQASKGNLVDSG